MSDFIFMVIIWGVLLTSLRRAWVRGELRNRSSRLIWSLFLCAGFAFVFRVPLIEAAINPVFNDVPVAYALKAIFVQLAIGQYNRMLRHILPPEYPKRVWLLWLIAAAILGIIGLLVLGALGILTPIQAQYSMMTLSDFAALLNMTVLFLPVNLRMYQQEQLEPMWMKHIATITFCAFYSAAAFITQVAGPYTVLTGKVTPLHDAIPVGMIVFFCFLIQVLPHRVLHKLLYFERLALLLKLRRLENRILALSGREAQPSVVINWLDEKQLQAATYTACINILDYSPAAAQKSVGGDLLYQKIMRAAAQDASYDTLANALARIP
jgi:hypothetical protein